MGGSPDRTPVMIRFLAFSALTSTLATGEITIIDDTKLLAGLRDRLGEFADSGEFPTVAEVAKALAESPKHVPDSLELKLTGQSSDDPSASVFLLGSVYKCDKCDDWHSGGVATAWALTRDGYLVTNHHVLDQERGAVVGVVDRSGKSYPIVSVVAADEDADVAIFKVDADDLTPLALGPEPRVGAEIRVISHPQRRFFTETYGRVSRYFRRPARRDRGESTWMTITADYAKGSSGGPVLDDKNRVVGMVSFTQSIYYNSQDNKPTNLQMVIKNTVPVRAMRDLLEAEAPVTAVEGVEKEAAQVR